jgi:uncharacterized protein
MTMKSALPLLWIAGLGAASLAAPQTTSDLESLAKDLTQQSAARQFDRIATHFDEAMASAMPAARLVELWDGLVGQMGAFQSIAGTRVQTVQGYQVVLVTSKFERATLNVGWVFDSKSRVAGFSIVPVEPDAPWTPPDYAKPASFHEQQIVVGSAPWQLPGTLTLPNGAGPFPAVVLVHGSGPQDRDEAIGPNKPFQDLAWGLASRNIAVVRYNKRTLQYGKEMQALGAGLTVQEETVEDARLAVALLAKRPEIDSRRIFVLGHSLGGMLAPRIARGDARVAGLVMLAGSTRPLEQVIVEQLKYIAGLDGKISPAAQKQIDAAEQSAKEIENPTLAADTKLNVLGATICGSYFLDLRSYHPAEVAAQLKIPMLILRGERDYQVTSADFDGWKKALAGKPEVTLRVYPGLFHLFMPSSSPGTGLGTPADYQKPGHVVEPVIEDIASWISVQRGGSK